MNVFNRLFPMLLLVTSSGPAFAQKQTYDVLQYRLPIDWQKKEVDGGLQLVITDNKTGEYAIALLIKSSASNTSANDNFTNYWNSLVKALVNVSGAPVMQSPVAENGWDIISGGANYADEGKIGTATLLSATGGGKMTAVVLMTNTKKYQNDLSALLNSLALSKASPNEDRSVIGGWANNILESSGGYYANNMYMPNYTGGYFRKRYAFYADGTYLFCEKDFSAYSNTILFLYETGTWSVNGNKLTVKPAKGKNERWSKNASGSNKEWGSLQKSTDRKLETITYTYQMHYYSGTNETSLWLNYDKSTERDGTNKSSDPWTYSSRSLDNSAQEDYVPPGWKIK